MAEDAAAAVGAVALVGFLLLTAFVVRLVVYYKAPLVTLGMALLVFVSWLLGFAGLMLLPADLAVIAEAGKDADTNMYRALWNFIYWSTFVLCWVVTPVLLQYALAGDFSWRARLRSALKANVKYYVFSALLLVGVCIYILAAAHYSFDALLGFLIAYANTYGMVLIVLLLGHGLVAVPRKLWEMASPTREVEALELIVPYVDHDLYDALFELEDCELEVKRLKETVESYERTRTLGDVTRLRDYVNQLQQTVDNFEYANQMRSMSKLRPHQPTKHDVPKEPAISESMCVQLNTRLRSAQQLVFRMRRRMDGLIQAYAKALADAEEMSTPPAMTSAGSALCARLAGCMAYAVAWLLWRWHSNFKFTVFKVMSVLCASLSVVLLWCEVTMVAPVNLSPLGHILAAVDVNSAHSAIFVQMLSFIPLAYMGTCMYWSLFRLKVVRSYSLEGPALSNEASLLFNAQMLARLQFSLCYNYILLLKYSPAEDTAFANLMQGMTIAPILGTSFNVYAPLMLVLLACFTLFNGYPKLLSLIGLIHEDAASIGSAEDLKERRREGERILRNNMSKMRTTDNSPRVFDKARGALTATPSGGANSVTLPMVKLTTSNSSMPLFTKLDDDSDDADAIV